MEGWMFMTVWGDCLSFPGSLYTPTQRKLLLQCRIDFIHLHIAITTFTDCWLPVSNDLLNRLIGSLSASQSVWQRYRLVTQKPLPLKPVTWLKHRPPPEADHAMLPPTTPLPKNPWWLHDTQACYREQNALKAAELWGCYPEYVQVMTPYTSRDDVVTPWPRTDNAVTP